MELLTLAAAVAIVPREKRVAIFTGLQVVMKLPEELLDKKDKADQVVERVHNSLAPWVARLLAPITAGRLICRQGENCVRNLFMGHLRPHPLDPQAAQQLAEAQNAAPGELPTAPRARLTLSPSTLSLNTPNRNSYNFNHRHSSHIITTTATATTATATAAAATTGTQPLLVHDQPGSQLSPSDAAADKLVQGCIPRDRNAMMSLRLQTARDLGIHDVLPPSTLELEKRWGSNSQMAMCAYVLKLSLLILLLEEWALNIKKSMAEETNYGHSEQFRYKEQITEKTEFIYNHWKKKNGQQDF
ncbi:hypothetical protein BX661DRAFT_226187 [Kickxella alabastrina]|uniref:uncharacterized protein n=1 Tax=Kickxella alabastrina TaxID=61397 RepID=UPI0022209888|nr:uncharacterized protein BX661DRAFT_226187 [Kickxella alabastrina]KAI7823439.1 hypothetical protein BX661DRAFT_226187 [Kickxella alabastrina]